ncbi:RING-H2 finger protein ATL16-like [Silene latifolia]|uniref:RING-H2 finger protein ATL16-like n=1 Tax=Silene latifolia TaxID=37657 RepID=UPI003D78A282
MHSSNSDFPIAIALLAIMAVALLLASYYIFVIKCCLNWQNLDPLRRFSISRARQNDEDQLISFSPMVGIHRGLDEWLINNIPAFQYKSGENNNNNNNSSRSSSISMSNSFRGCAVCLNGFKEQEILRNLPKCGHNFHLDCIDVWLLKNASCPLCRSSISGRTKYPIDHIIAPSSSPQDMLSPLFSGNLSFNINENEQDFLVIELSQEQTPRSVSEQKGIHQNGKKSRKLHRLSMMGDECINIRRKDEQFTIQQPIRRSISMDSAVDRGLYLQVQEILRQNNNEIVSNNNEVSSSSNNNVSDECNSSNGRVRRSSFFSFGHGRGSRTSSSILPL